ncbi:hypothetical protein [Tabrizicola sp.]|uniref:hypothetical protein n=1 Tax=Tabrizicola sp. TaxID=2005166 RepID=UPI0035B14AC9
MQNDQEREVALSAWHKKSMLAWKRCALRSSTTTMSSALHAQPLARRTGRELPYPLPPTGRA